MIKSKYKIKNVWYHYFIAVWGGILLLVISLYSFHVYKILLLRHSEYADYCLISCVFFGLFTILVTPPSLYKMKRYIFSITIYDDYFKLNTLNIINNNKYEFSSFDGYLISYDSDQNEYLTLLLYKKENLIFSNKYYSNYVEIKNYVETKIEYLCNTEFTEREFTLTKIINRDYDYFIEKFMLN